MNKEDLQQRIEKVKEKITKIEKRIAKWSKGMRPDAIEVCKVFGDVTYGTPEYTRAYDNYKEYKKNNIDGLWSGDPKLNDLFNPDDWNKGPNFNELYSAYRDLSDVKNTLHKYNVQMDKQINFENQEKIEVIWSFLQNWKQKVNDFIHENAMLLKSLKDTYQQDWVAYKETEEYKTRYNNLPLRTSWDGSRQYRDNSIIERDFREKYFSEISSLTYKFYKYNGQVEEKQLDDYLNKEVVAKYNDLIARITEKAGQIVDANDLYIGAKGEINGYVQGTNHKVHVETIGAGGYNIQIFHYRTLVHIVD